MQIIKVSIIILLICIVTGCSNKKEKCMLIVDENNNKIYDAKVKFSSIKKRNTSSSGNMVTTFTPFYEVSIILTKKENNLICFKNYKYKDNQFIYDNLRIWKIYNDEYNVSFSSFNSIPSKVILKKKNDNASDMKFLQNSENVYDLNNIIIRTPNNHIKKTIDTKKANKK